jgi:hypothetical protein
LNSDKRAGTATEINLAMEHINGHLSLPADYYRRHAAKIRALADDATTAAVKQHLHEAALEYERLAEFVEASGSNTAGD